MITVPDILQQHQHLRHNIPVFQIFPGSVTKPASSSAAASIIGDTSQILQARLPVTMTEKTFLLANDETVAMTLVAALGTAASIILASTHSIA